VIRGISPREAWLERRVSELEQQVKYIGSIPRFSMCEPPETLAVHKLDHTLNIASTVELKSEGLGLHVLASETRRDGVSVGYYLDRISLENMSTAARADVMYMMHEKVLFDLGRKFWS